ncbi:MAG TPA: tetratricopeptide repeat protein [Allocoleopsis sp.]
MDKEKFTLEYEAGKMAFERGEYGRSIAHLEKAIAYVSITSSLGGEAQIWLVTALDAAGEQEKALALCRKLVRHQSVETRKQSKQLLYILSSPKLARNPEWLTEIPDLTKLSESESKFQKPSSNSNSKSYAKSKDLEPIDLSQVNTKDNDFVWIALIAIIVIFSGLFWTMNH